MAVWKGDPRKMQGRKARCELSVANHVKSDDVGDSRSSVGVRPQRQQEGPTGPGLSCPQVGGLGQRQVAMAALMVSF